MLRSTGASKRSINRALDSRVLESVCEQNDFQPLPSRDLKIWSADNRTAIDAYNERIGREGLPLAKYRTF